MAFFGWNRPGTIARLALLLAGLGCSGTLPSDKGPLLIDTATGKWEPGPVLPGLVVGWNDAKSQFYLLSENWDSETTTVATATYKGEVLEKWRVDTPLNPLEREYALSPDGTRLVYFRIHQTKGPSSFEFTWELCVRTLATAEVLPVLTGTDIINGVPIRWASNDRFVVLFDNMAPKEQRNTIVSFSSPDLSPVVACQGKNLGVLNEDLLSASPDGRHIVFEEGGSSMWVLDFINNRQTLVPDADCIRAAWSPDSSMLAFFKKSSHRLSLWKVSDESVREIEEAPRATSIETNLLFVGKNRIVYTFDGGTFGKCPLVIFELESKTKRQLRSKSWGGIVPIENGNRILIGSMSYSPTIPGGAVAGVPNP